MFGLGLWELALILLVVIIFVNPEELPGFFRRVGRVYRQLRDINRELSKRLREWEREAEGKRRVEPGSGAEAGGGNGVSGGAGENEEKKEKEENKRRGGTL